MWKQDENIKCCLGNWLTVVPFMVTHSSEMVTAVLAMLESAEDANPMIRGNNVAVAAKSRIPTAEINSVSHEDVTTQCRALCAPRTMEVHWAEQCATALLSETERARKTLFRGQSHSVSLLRPA